MHPTWSRSFALGRPSWTDSSSSAKIDATLHDRGHQSSSLISVEGHRWPDSLAAHRNVPSEVCMLLLIWCVLGLLLGIFVRRRSVALLLGIAVWSISFATIAARSSYPLPTDGDSVGAFATLIVAMLGCMVGGFLREHR